MGYMTQHFKGKYRLLCPIDKNTNDFPKTLKDTNEEIDIYITCAKDGQISHYGHGILEYYIPSLQAGNNIIKEIYAKYINPNNVEISNKETCRSGKTVRRTTYYIKDEEQFNNDISSNKHIIFNVNRTDGEVIFRFKTRDEDKIIPILKPKTSGANISPFSKRNLPKCTYIIPDEALKVLKSEVENYPETSPLDIAHITTSYIKSLATRKHTFDDIKSEMKLMKLGNREYIHQIGKWDDFIKYVRKELKEMKK